MSKLLTEISRVKNLIRESESDFSFIYDGEIDEGLGLVITLSCSDGEVGKISLLDLDSSRIFDPDIVDFEKNSDKYCKVNCNKGHFNSDNTIYSHSLEVDEPFRGKGYGNELKKEIENVAKQLGFRYIMSIVNCDNIQSQGLNKKFGYKPHQSNGVKDFLYKELN